MAQPASLGASAPVSPVSFDNPRERLRAELADSDITLTMGDGWSRLYGTLAQLRANAPVPADLVLPEGRKDAAWKVGQMAHTLYRTNLVVAHKLGRGHQANDCWTLDVRPSHFRPRDPKSDLIAWHLDEIARIHRWGSPEWQREHDLLLAARRDPRFQRSLGALIAPTQPRRGRKPAQAKTTTTTE